MSGHEFQPYNGKCVVCDQRLGESAHPTDEQVEIAALLVRVASLEKAREDICNSTTFDTTDGACPAWWRGDDHGWAKGQKRIAELERLLREVHYFLSFLDGRYDSAPLAERIETAVKEPTP